MKEKIEELEKLYSEITELTPEKMELLVSESIRTFEVILTKMHSGNEEEKKEAVAFAERLRDNLEKQAEKAVEKLKLTTDDLDSYTKNPDNFSKEDWAALEKSREELNSYKEDVKARSSQPVEKKPIEKKKKKLKPAWIAG